MVHIVVHTFLNLEESGIYCGRYVPELGGRVVHIVVHTFLNLEESGHIVVHTFLNLEQRYCWEIYLCTA